MKRLLKINKENVVPQILHTITPNFMCFVLPSCYFLQRGFFFLPLLFFFFFLLHNAAVLLSRCFLSLPLGGVNGGEVRVGRG